MRITLTFVLAEDVTPDYLAYRVAAACHTEYALRPGEGVELPSNPSILLTSDGSKAELTPFLVQENNQRLTPEREAEIQSWVDYFRDNPSVWRGKTLTLPRQVVVDLMDAFKLLRRERDERQS